MRFPRRGAAEIFNGLFFLWQDVLPRFFVLSFSGFRAIWQGCGTAHWLGTVQGYVSGYEYGTCQGAAKVRRGMAGLWTGCDLVRPVAMRHVPGISPLVTPPL